MMSLTHVLALLGSLCAAKLVQGAPGGLHPDGGHGDKEFKTIEFDGRSFVNKGIVGCGRVDVASVDQYGETLGGLGSSIVLESLEPAGQGTLKGVLRSGPDRGHNTVTTTDYRARSHVFDFTFKPTHDQDETGNVQLEYRSTSLFRTSPSGNFTTGLDALGLQANSSGLLPVAPRNNHVAFDVEGSAPSNVQGIQFVSDEYGPYIYTWDVESGLVLATTTPPKAILPYINGQINFTSETQPESGRGNNQGWEGLTFHRKSSTLWSLLQSACIQDSDKGSKTSRRYARLLGWDARDPMKLKLMSEYIVPLPVDDSGRVLPQSEIEVIDDETFLVLARDSKGLGDDDPKSSYKHADLVSIKGATNIAGTKYDDPDYSITPDKGKTLHEDIVPAKYESFVDLVDAEQLAKCGIHNGGNVDEDLISAKLESLALVNEMDPASGEPTGDQLLFVLSDNDYITAHGRQAAQVGDGSYQVESYVDPFSNKTGVDVDTQVYVYRVSLAGFGG